MSLFHFGPLSRHTSKLSFPKWPLELVILRMPVWCCRVQGEKSHHNNYLGFLPYLNLLSLFLMCPSFLHGADSKIKNVEKVTRSICNLSGHIYAKSLIESSKNTLYESMTCYYLPFIYFKKLVLTILLK